MIDGCYTLQQNHFNMKKQIFSILGIIIMFAVSSCNDQRRAKNYNDKTLADLEAINFVNKGIGGSLTEIKAAKIAKSRSLNPRIIAFADMMITDHNSVANQLKKIQTDKLITDRNGITPEHEKMLAELSAKSGVEFDKAYMKMMVEDHEKDIELFESVAHNTSATIQDFAEKTLPTLHKHLDSAKEINSSLK